MPKFLLLLLGLLAAGPALAQTQAAPAAPPAAAGQLPAFTSSAPYQAMIDNTFATLPPPIFTRCPRLVSNSSTITVLQPVAFFANGVPSAGAWEQSFPVSGCGNDTTINFYLFVSPADQKLHTIIGLPGTSPADLTLQQDALNHARLAASALLKSCTEWLPLDAKFIAYGLTDPAAPDPGPGNQNRPWHESWTLMGCHHRVVETIDYVPQPNGTEILAPARDARLAD